MTSLGQQHAVTLWRTALCVSTWQTFGTANLRIQTDWSFKKKCTECEVWELPFQKVREFTVTVILVLFATLLNATSDVCRSLLALISVTANSNVSVSFSRLSAREPRMVIQNIYTVFRYFRTRVGGEGMLSRTVPQFCTATVTINCWWRTRGQGLLWQLQASLLIVCLCPHSCMRCWWFFVLWTLNCTQ